MLKNKFIYCFYVVLYFLYVFALGSCTTSSKSKSKKEIFLADATPVANSKANFSPVFIKNKIDFDDFSVKNPNAEMRLQISHAEIQEVFKNDKEKNTPINLSTNLPKIRLYVQLSDTNGNYLQNANTTKNRKIWCNFSDEMVEGKRVEIPNYAIKELSDQENKPHAIALVLDHSGSMGKERTILMQKAVQEFIKNKKPEDAILLIKYDEKHEVVQTLTTDKNILLEKLKIIGLKGFGGVSAVADATHRSVDILKDAPNYDKKIAIVFTDGADNLSKISSDSLVNFANYQKVNICSFDFGNVPKNNGKDDLKESSLEKIAKKTGGFYQQIYKTTDFNFIFRDIYMRLRNSYVVEFTPKGYGKHNLALKMCFDKKQTTAYHQVTILPNINQVIPLNIIFDTNKFVIKNNTKNDLEALFVILQGLPDVEIEIRNHTDNVGDEEKNRLLSQKRADAIADNLVKRGINIERIKAVGIGEKNPITSNETALQRAENRRTEFLIIKK